MTCRFGLYFLLFEKKSLNKAQGEIFDLIMLGFYEK